MEITTEQIYDYMECPIIYHLRHASKIKIDPNINYHFSRQIHKAIASFYFNLMNNRVLNEEEMKKKWSQLWAKNLTLGELLTEHHASHMNKRRSLQLTGVKMLLNHHRKFISNPGVPICVDESFRIPIGKHMVRGTWDLIRERKANNSKPIVEIIDFKAEVRRPTILMTEQDINLSIQSLAFRQLFQAKEERIVYHYLRDGKEYITTRSAESFTQLTKFIDNVGDGIEQKLIYPRQSDRCRECEYASQCAHLWR